MPLLLNSAKYCWYNYFCVVLLPCGVEPNVIPAPPGSNPRALHIRPSGSQFSRSTGYDQCLCGFGSTQIGTCRETQTFFWCQWRSPKINHISCAMPFFMSFSFVFDALKFCILECRYVTTFLHFGPWYFWGSLIVLILNLWLHTSSQTTQLCSEITCNKCLFMLHNISKC